MPNILLKDANEDEIYVSVVSGTGTSGSPYVLSADRATETTLDEINTATGALADAVVSAGATGSLSAKLRRLTTDLDAANTKLTNLLTELQSKADLSETQPVSVATLPTLAAGTNNIGDVDILTLPSLVTGTATVGAVKDAGPNLEGTRVRSALTNLTTAQDITAAPSSEKRHRLLEVDLTASAACVITLQSEMTPGNERVDFQFLSAGTQSRTWRNPPVAIVNKKWQATSDTSVNLKISVATEEIT